MINVPTHLRKFDAMPVCLYTITLIMTCPYNVLRKLNDFCYRLRLKAKVTSNLGDHICKDRLPQPHNYIDIKVHLDSVMSIVVSVIIAFL